eukprot:scaffold79_cov259-Pinguiococcus_pyrenoidosus.AAC.38
MAFPARVSKGSWLYTKENSLNSWISSPTRAAAVSFTIVLVVRRVASKVSMTLCSTRVVGLTRSSMGVGSKPSIIMTSGVMDVTSYTVCFSCSRESSRSAKSSSIEMDADTEPVSLTRSSRRKTALPPLRKALHFPSEPLTSSESMLANTKRDRRRMRLMGLRSNCCMLA